MNHPSLRLTPSNSPFFKNTSPRSPTKASRSEEPGLRLTKAIGTTTTSVNGFDFLSAARQFAYTAGAAAVVATVDQDLQIHQRFFKARPTLAGLSREASGHLSATPTPNEARNRTFGHLREHGSPGSPLGASGRDWSDSPTGRSITAKDRVKSATSVALSPNGKWLAVGETGYKPRILIFSLAEGSNDVPVAALAEHTFGVHALSFSPDSKYLASLGTVNDGFLFVWSVEDTTGSLALYASNKCTTQVNHMQWMGQSLITAGLRFVKVWRLDEDVNIERRTDSTLSPHTPRTRLENRSSEFSNSILNPRHKVLSGKNSLLGEMLEATFITVLPISDAQAVICAESGDICLLDDREKAQTLTTVTTIDFTVSSAALGENGDIRVVGPLGQAKEVMAAELQQRSTPISKQSRRKTISPGKFTRSGDTKVIAMANLDDGRIEINSKGGIAVIGTSDDRRQQLQAHSSSILGVQAISGDEVPGRSFLTFSGNGEIQIWDEHGGAIESLTIPFDSSPEMYDVVNELKAVTSLASASMLACGDKYGNLVVVDIRTRSIVQRLRAHSAEITDICAFSRAGQHFVATASRDRTVQMFMLQDGILELAQTLDEHAGAVTGLMSLRKGDWLLSSSADRSIVVREAIVCRGDGPMPVAYGMTRTLALKSAPTCICAGEDDNTIWVSTTDRCISKYTLSSGQATLTFKCSDPDGGEAAVMSDIFFVPSLNSNPTLVGVTSSDKSVRLYTEYGTLLARDWGHTEGITGLAVLQDTACDGTRASNRVVTAAADSTIFLWDTTSAANAAHRLADDEDSNAEVAAARPTPIGPPLRKVISHSELSRYKREPSIDEGGEASPDAAQSPIRAAPYKLRKKTSKVSLAQAPKLEPAFKSSFVNSSRRGSLARRSPSPPSPRNTIKKDSLRRPSTGTSLRSKGTENVLSSFAAPSPSPPTTSSGFGSLAASTDSVCRTLRSYRKKLVTSSSSERISPEQLRELEKELKLTARVLNEKSQGKTLDEAMMARMLDQASEKIVGMLDERIKSRVESEVQRRSSEASPLVTPRLERPAEVAGSAEAIAGALESVKLEEGGPDG